MMPFSKKSNSESFRIKLLWILRFSLIAGLLLTGASVITVQTYLLNANLKKDLEVVANIFGDRSVAALIFDDANTAMSILRAARFNSSLLSACIYRNNGVLFAYYYASESGQACLSNINKLAAAKERGKSGFFDYTYLSTIDDGSDQQGWIYVEASKQGIYQALLIFISLTSIAVILISMASSKLAHRLLNQAMEPLNDLHQTAISISEDILSQRRATKISKDEVGELVDVFNNMLDSIASETRELTISEERFRTLTANAPIGIFQLDKDLNFEYANEKWKIITGLEATKESYNEHKSKIYSEDQLSHQKFWKANQASNTSNPLEYRYQSNSGEMLYLIEYVSPLLRSSKDGKGYIGTLFDVTELKNAQLELEKLAFFDPLTDLPNRRFFRDHLDLKLSEAKRTICNLAVMMIDLDNFKKVNDTLGHDAGDELLQNIAVKLKNIVREQDVVSRMGGDEFLILLTSDVDGNLASVLAQRILDEFIDPHIVRNQPLDISASIGVSIYPDDGMTTEELIKNADIALYHAKELGRHRTSFYSKELDQRIREKHRIESKLKKALDNGVLEIYLQPQYSSDNLQIVWAEALLRWVDDAEGDIPPGKFIPIAEEAGLIHRVGRYVFERVCYDLDQHNKYLALVGIKGVSINLSAPQLYSKNLVSDISHVLKEFNVDASSIELEITESMVMNDIEMAISVMKKIRDLGCRISIDDFGTGYSSLSYLSRFPINSVKIDRSFVSRIPRHSNDAEIASAIIAMSHKLGLSVVAEGVETEDQKEFLIEQGCELLQGFHLARPENINHFVALGRQRSLKLVDNE